MHLVLHQVSFSYGGNHQALSRINLSLNEGSICCVIGPTGSGKSTLLSMVAGLLPPQSGTITLDGTQVPYQKGGHSSILRKKTGLLFQYPERQLFSASVGEDVAFGPKNEGIHGEALTKRVHEALEAVDLSWEAFGHRSPFKLSGGEKRRVALAGVLATEPELLVLDEPMAGLDPKSRHEFRNLLQRLREQGRSILMVSHDMDDVALLAQQVVVLDKGTIAMAGTSAEVFANYERLVSLGLGVSHAQQLAYNLQTRRLPLSQPYYDEESLGEELRILFSS